MAVDGASIRSIVMESPATFVRNHRGLGIVKRLFSTHRRFRPNLQCELYFGKTGTGKTYRAFTENERLFRKPIGKLFWFDGYDADEHDSVFIDEFMGQFPLDAMLQILDIYEVQVEIKGDHVWLDVDKIIIATNTHPTHYYESWFGREAQYAAFCRRFKRVLFFKSRDDVTELTTPEELEQFWEQPELYTWNWFK